MIELLLQAERSLAMGLVDQAEVLYRQAAEADPRNSIAVVGLARVALERADDANALRLARRALVIDPENAAASRLVARLEEVMTYRGEALPTPDEAVEPAVGAARVAPVAPVEATPPATAADTAPQPTPRARGPLDRLLRRSRR